MDIKIVTTQIKDCIIASNMQCNKSLIICKDLDIFSRCAYGYYGDPLIPGGECLKCDCSDHSADVDPMCDAATGVCTSCTGNRKGDRCERCIDDHYIDSRGECVGTFA